MDTSQWYFKDYGIQLCSPCSRTKSTHRSRTYVWDVRRGFAENCFCCTLVWDVLETWNQNESENERALSPSDLEIDYFTSPGNTIRITLWVPNPRSRFALSTRCISLVVIRNAGKFYFF